MHVSFRNSEAAIVVTPGILALVTKFRPIEPPEEYFYSEVEFLSAFEVRALAATMLAQKFGTGSMQLYPVVENYQDATFGCDLSKIRILKTLLQGLIPCLDSGCHESAIHKPPCLGGRDYNFNEHSEIDRRRFARVFRMIDVRPSSGAVSALW